VADDGRRAATGAAARPAHLVTGRHALLLIAFVVLCFALQVASALVVPIVLSVLVALTLAPAVRAVMHLRLPRAVAATLVLFAAIGVAYGVAVALAEPAREWVAQAPQALKRLERNLAALRAPLLAASEATEDLMSMADAGPDAPERVVEAGPGLLATVLEHAPVLFASIFATLFLVYLLLLNGEALLRKFLALAPTLTAKKEFVAITREAQSELSRYLVTVSAINAGLGALTALGLQALGVPDPWLWGGIAALLNFAPYVGAALTTLALVVVGLTQFPDLMTAAAVPGVFVALNLIEGQLVTPYLVGRRLALDPVVIFVALMLLGWLWGIAGLLIAVPLLTCLKIVLQRVPGGEPYVTLLTQHGDNGAGGSEEAATG
jgi:predicted PurR-regulated permease PerM